jgi:hypothetical protein
VKAPYVGGFSYWYRTRGMQTSTDDVIVTLLAIYPDATVDNDDGNGGGRLLPGPRAAPPEVYVDLGCGIGSSLLVVAHELRPALSVGVEAQPQSVQLLARTLQELGTGCGTDATPPSPPRITCVHADLRDFTRDSKRDSSSTDTVLGRCALITANPPYAKLEEGTLPQDPQRCSARFELRGGVEDYTQAASRLLLRRDNNGDGATTTATGRLVLSFWTRDHERVVQAAAAAGLRIHRQVDIDMGHHGSSVYDMRPQTTGTGGGDDPGPNVQTWRIQRDPVTGRMADTYKQIRTLLHLHPRPLRRPSRKE